MIPISDSEFSIAAIPNIRSALQFRHCLYKKGVSYSVINAAHFELLSLMMIEAVHKASTVSNCFHIFERYFQ